MRFFGVQQARKSSLLLLQHTQAEATSLQKLNETFRANLALLQSRNNYQIIIIMIIIIIIIIIMQSERSRAVGEYRKNSQHALTRNRTRTSS